jgi:hypothetical protein
MVATREISQSLIVNIFIEADRANCIIFLRYEFGSERNFAAELVDLVLCDADGFILELCSVNDVEEKAETAYR